MKGKMPIVKKETMIDRYKELRRRRANSTNDEFDGSSGVINESGILQHKDILMQT